jgi:hypothetical protein
MIRSVMCIVLFVLPTLLMTLSACNNVQKPKGSASVTSTLTQAPSQQFSSASAFTLSQVLPSQHSGGLHYDMIGVNDEFDQYCGSALTACSCEYTFSIPNLGPQPAEVAAVVYAESNLVRCINQVPSGIAQFSVRVISNENSQFSSNSLDINLNGATFAGSTSFLDLTSPQSFVSVNRYQCRRNESIMHPMDGGIIDPLQSENPNVIYPFNYYTTNVGESVLKLQRSSDQSWQCSLQSNSDQSLQWWTNPLVFSASPCSVTNPFCAGEQELMYPQVQLESGLIPQFTLSNNGRKRASFSLAKQAYGVFNTQVEAVVAPNNYSGGKISVIGYGARPIPVAGGTSVCPSIPLPANATWVKLFAFKATNISAPRYVNGSTAILNTAIACNPSATAFPSCAFDNVLGAYGNCGAGNFGCAIGLQSGGRTTRIAKMSNGNADACYNIDENSWISGAETWIASPYAFGNFSNPPDLATLRTLPWNVYAGITAVSAATDATRAVSDVQNATPFDSAVVTQPLNQNQNYTDHLFVVADPLVSDDAMLNGTAPEYKPVTYRSRLDCNSTTRSGCPIGKEINWGLTSLDMSEAGQPPGADLRTVCVVQFYESP